MTEASRDMDIAVGKLMGLKEPDDFGVVERHDWQFNEDDEYGTYVCHRCRRSSKVWAKPSDLTPGPCDLTPWLPHYSTSIAAAWEVVEYMRTKDWFGLVGYREWGMNEGEMFAEFRKPDGPEPTYWARAHTAPLAICRAALAALDRT